MLAGRIKLNTFLAVAGLLGIGAIGAGGFWWSTRPDPPPEPPAVVARAEEGPREVTPQTGAAQPQDTVRTFLVAQAGKDLGAAKKKDALSGSIKINLYQDDGHSTVNRAKVDLDRDDRWDEKWTFHDDGTISRKVSPDDDEQYTAEYVLGPDGSWRGPDAEAAPPAATAVDAAREDGGAADAIATLPWEEQALSYVGADLGTTKRKDVSKGRQWKINVYQDDGHATANRLKIDLDRDDRWDQKWTFHDDGAVTRKIAPQDDEDYTRRERRVDGRWVEDAG